MTALEFDFVCVGGGLGGLAGAVRAADLGLDVLVLEKSPYLGGVAAYSGGVVWVGNNHISRDGDRADSAADVEKYLDWTSGEGVLVDQPLRDAFVDNAPRAVEYFADAGVAFQSTELPDQYYPDAPGSLQSGRILEATVEGAQLGRWRPLCRESPHFRLVGLTHREVMEAGGDLVAADLLADLLAERKRDDVLTWGPGLAAAFAKAAVVDRDVRVHVDSPVVGLIQDGNRVSGVVAIIDGDQVEITARHGVLIATGSYGNAPYAASFEGLPEIVEASPPVLDGDHLSLTDPTPAAIVRAGRPFLLLGFESLGETHPGTDVTLHRELSRGLGLPHSMVVNRAGRRFGDESFYGFILAAVQAYDGRAKAYPNYPCFLIGDDRYRTRYPLGDRETWPEDVIGADDVEGLAAALGIDAAGLRSELAVFNESAEEGSDPRFQRGTLEYSRLRAGDPNQTPNPNLGAVAVPPFWGIPLKLIGTGIYSMGLAINGSGQALTRSGAEVPSLYTTGNAAAYTEQPGYIGGLANTRAITYAYTAAGHAAGQS